MSLAYRCDECGEFFEGQGSRRRTIKFGDWQATITIDKAAKPLAEKAEGVDISLDSSHVGTVLLSHWGSEPKSSPTFCEDCLDTLVNSAHVL